MSDRYTIISADGHAGADLLDYKPYLPSSWHDEFDAWAGTYVNPYAAMSFKSQFSLGYKYDRASNLFLILSPLLKSFSCAFL